MGASMGSRPPAAPPGSARDTVPRRNGLWGNPPEGGTTATPFLSPTVLARRMTTVGAGPDHRSPLRTADAPPGERALLERAREHVGRAFEANRALADALEEERWRRHALAHLLPRGRDALSDAGLAKAIDEVRSGRPTVPREGDVDRLFDAAQDTLRERHLDLDEDAQELAELADAMEPHEGQPHQQQQQPPPQPSPGAHAWTAIATGIRAAAAHPLRTALRGAAVLGHALVLGAVPGLLGLFGLLDAATAGGLALSVGGLGVVGFVVRSVALPFGSPWPSRPPDPARYPEQRLQLLAFRYARALEVAPPEVRVVHAPEPAVRALGHRRGPSQLVVTTGALRSLDPREVGPIVARELVLLATGEAAVRRGLELMRAPADGLGKALGHLTSLVAFRALARTHRVGGRLVWRPALGAGTVLLAPIATVLALATAAATTWRLAFRTLGVLDDPLGVAAADARAARISDPRRLASGLRRIDEGARRLRLIPPTPLLGALDLVDPELPRVDAPGVAHLAFLERWLEGLGVMHPPPPARAGALEAGDGAASVGPRPFEVLRTAALRLAVVLAVAGVGAVAPAFLAAASRRPPAPAVIAALTPAEGVRDTTNAPGGTGATLVEIVALRGCHLRAEATVESDSLEVMPVGERCARAGDQVGPWFPMVCGPRHGWVHRSCLPRAFSREAARQRR